MTFKCEHCGKEYDNISAAQACEEACQEKEKKIESEKKQEIEKFKCRAEELQNFFQTYKERGKELERARNAYNEALTNFTKDYPNYSIKVSGDGDNLNFEVEKLDYPERLKDIFNDVNKLFTGEKEFPTFKHFWF
jgi:hypothetical protein